METLRGFLKKTIPEKYQNVSELIMVYYGDIDEPIIPFKIPIPFYFDNDTCIELIAMSGAESYYTNAGKFVPVKKINNEQLATVYGELLKFNDIEDFNEAVFLFTQRIKRT